ncbi:MAG: hypothetical protein ACT4QC_21980 [Planctomycetaceae bacterium]
MLQAEMLQAEMLQDQVLQNEVLQERLLWPAELLRTGAFVLCSGRHLLRAGPQLLCSVSRRLLRSVVRRTGLGRRQRSAAACRTSPGSPGVVLTNPPV